MLWMGCYQPKLYVSFPRSVNEGSIPKVHVSCAFLLYNSSLLLMLTRLWLVVGVASNDVGSDAWAIMAEAVSTWAKPIPTIHMMRIAAPTATTVDATTTLWGHFPRNESTAVCAATKERPKFSAPKNSTSRLMSKSFLSPINVIDMSSDAQLYRPSSSNLWSNPDDMGNNLKSLTPAAARWLQWLVRSYKLGGNFMFLILLLRNLVNHWSSSRQGSTRHCI